MPDRLAKLHPHHSAGATAQSPQFRPTGQRLRKLRGLARAVFVPLLLGALITAGSPGWSAYTVRNGDNLGSIAKRYHTTVRILVRANHLPGNGNLVYAGATIKVPVPRPPRPRTVTIKRRHRVVAGDSVIRIARKYGVAPATITRANHLSKSGLIRLGETLVVPVHRRVPPRRNASSTNTFAGRTYSAAVVRAANRNRAILARHREPTRHQMRALIVRTARRHGVDPNLALAVSWQESGWNMRRVSVANAVGAMQVVPSTGQWVSIVVGRHLNLLNPRDNATAGVVLLKVLSRSAKEKHAVAGYYQGLRSVKERGMFADTRQYVANVLALKKHFARH